MIDKKIFYCWFGTSEMSDLNKQCIESWKKACPDYQIIKISEDNYDWGSNPYAKQNYEAGNWSGVSNAARLEFLKKYSGFYLDTDVQLFQSLDPLREYDRGFITEFESGQPDSGVLGRGSVFPNVYAEALSNLVPNRILHKEFIKVLYRDYDIHGQDMIVNAADGFAILGESYFPTVRSGLLLKNTIGIHYFENTWVKNYIQPTDGFYPFPRMNVYIRNKCLLHQEDATVNLTIRVHNKRWDSNDILTRTCYLFNPKVIKLFCKEFEATKINYNELAPQYTTITASGMIVTYTE